MQDILQSPRQLAQYRNPLGWRNKVARAAWGAAWLLLYRTSPRPFHAWRRFILRCFGAKVGRGVRPYPQLKIWAPWNLEVGDHCWLADGVDCYSVARIRLGKNVIVSQRSFLCTATHDYTDPKFPLRAAPITIEDGAWVAAEAFIGPGVVIGEAAVVGARACVVKDVARGLIVGGNPACVLKDRQTDNRTCG